MLIQEFHIKLDIGFINALIKMTEKYELSEEERVGIQKMINIIKSVIYCRMFLMNYFFAFFKFKMFNEDLSYASKPLQSQITSISLQEQKNYYDMLHFSPLKVCIQYLIFIKSPSHYSCI